MDEQIRRMFERFDVNKSGTMCVRELGACLQSLGIDTTHTEAENALQVLITHHLLATTHYLARAGTLLLCLLLTLATHY